VSDLNWSRLPAIAGIIAAILFAAGLLIAGNPPSIDSSNSEIVAYFVDDRGQILTGVYLQVLAVIPLLLFTVGFSRLLRRAEGDDNLASTAVLVSAAAVGAGLILASGLYGSLAFGAKSHADEATFRALFNLQEVGSGFVTMLLAGFLLATGVGIVRTGVLAKWLGWAAIAVGLLNVVAAGALASDGALAPGGDLRMVAVLLAVAVVIVVSVLMLMGERAPKGAAAAAPAAG
jgi:hypothetical protein